MVQGNTWEVILGKIKLKGVLTVTFQYWAVLNTSFNWLSCLTWLRGYFEGMEIFIPSSLLVLGTLFLKSLYTPGA